MTTRDELAALIYPYFGTPDGDFDALNAADAILARWRLVPVPCAVPFVSPAGVTLARCDGTPGHDGQHSTREGGGFTWN